jgi:(1->4)-alpha-D-glucan 1-alpha-D-glucosylmutase
MTGALSTYRLQLTKEFDFAQAAALIPYLKALGITHVYASPFMRARRGSTHGYDVVDHAAFNPELGGETGFETLSAALKANGLKLILDFVPNHMGVHFADNAWWLDVLEWGPKSRFAKSFDIDWGLLPHRRTPGILLPILGTSYGDALNNGDIELDYDAQAGTFSAHYFEHRLPIAPQGYGEILKTVVAATNAKDSDTGRALLALAKTYGGPGVPDAVNAARLKDALKDIPDAEPVIRRGLVAFRPHEGPTQAHALHMLLERQHYRLSHWKLANSDINYRRFFDVSSLAGLRVEDRETFDRVHALVMRLIEADKIQGLRIDHIDGLRDPIGYLQHLRKLIRDAQSCSPRPFILLIEKILAEHEPLDVFKACDGTTGYEWMNLFSRVLLAAEGHAALKDTLRQATGLSPSFAPILLAAKQHVLDTLFVSEFTVLTQLLARIPADHSTTRDYSADSLRQALTLFVLHFPVYRTYIRGTTIRESDRRTIEATLRQARRHWIGADNGIFDFLHDLLTLDLLRPGRGPRSPARIRRFIAKLQQFTGPLMAKSLEDTAFYRFPLLLALNEVGGDPAASPVTLPDFHHRMSARAKHWPRGLTSTATHDTKRGEDARMRILSIAELAGEWRENIGRWKALNAQLVTQIDGHRCPSNVDEYMIYQALVGAWPLEGVTPSFVERFKAYVRKAVREEKLNTSWLNPNAAYEEGILAFVEGTLNSAVSEAFLASFSLFARRAALLGALNSLSQLTLKATVPGVPDFYQGTEVWDLSLVDPDNRRPVDFSLRAKLLQDGAGDPPSAQWEAGNIKLKWTAHLLRLRARHGDVFSHGDYEPLTVQGAHADHVIAFSRSNRNKAISVVTLRHFAPLMKNLNEWPDFRHIDATICIADQRVDIASLLRGYPSAILVHDDLPAAAHEGRRSSPA